MKKHPLLTYVLLAYSITWTIAFFLIATNYKLFGITVSYNLHYLTAYGPMLAALCVVGYTKGKGGLKLLLSKITKWRVKYIWYLLAFSPLITYLLITGISYFQGKPTNFSLLGDINFLPNWGLATIFVWIFNSGLGEEVGWRGFALPELQKKYSPIKASIILGLLWAGWHLPFFFYLPTYTGISLYFLPFFVIGILSGSIIYTWIYNRTNEGILITILFHSVFNFITASKAGEGLPSAIITTLIIVSAAILLLTRPQGLNN